MMDIDSLRVFFGWCALINMGVLLWWFLWLLLAKNFVYRVQNKWFSITEQQFEVIHYCAMGMFKLTVFVFFVIPYLVLRFAF